MLFVPIAAVILATWWWLGAPIALPASPLAVGEKLYCMSYSPFRDGQTPFDRTLRIDPHQIEDDLARLAAVTDCVRTYSTELGLDQVAGIAERHGLKVIQGIWLGRERERNQREIETAVALAARYPDTVRALVAGNEVLLRGELSPADLAALIREVKGRVAVPVTYAEVWEFWLRNRAVADAVDFVTIHILPYWEDVPIPADQAASHVAEIHRMVAAAFPGKEILLGEVGWPSAGRMREGALPSPVNQARVVEDVLAVAKRDGFRANVIEAFDQPWKRQLEGTVGGHWGLLDGKSRAPKFAWGVPLSNHPGWLWQAALGVLLAGAVLLAATVQARRTMASPACAQWFGVAATGLVPGVLIGWAFANVPLESLGVGGWFHSLAMLALALISPVIGAAALTGNIPVPSFSEVLGRPKNEPPARVGLTLGICWVVLCAIAAEVALGLAFDPRYRDFPFPALGAAAAPFLVLALLEHDPEKWIPVFGERSCSNNNLKRDGNPALGTGARRRELAEIVMAALLAASTIYIAYNEGSPNWQSLCLCGVFAAIVIALLRPPVWPSSK